MDKVIKEGAPLLLPLIVYGFCILLISVEDRLGGTVAIVCSVCLFRHYCKYELNNVSSMFFRSIKFGIIGLVMYIRLTLGSSFICYGVRPIGTSV